MADDPDVIVVGGGPVGLHAALKAAILNHRVLVLDKGRAFSRVSQAPALANVPGHTGISGPELIEMGRRSLRDFAKASGHDIVTVLDEVEAVAARRDDDGRFVVTTRAADGVEREHRGRVLVLATGVVDRKPGIDAFWRKGHATLAPWVRRGELGYCVLCEGWALDGKRIAVVGQDADTVTIAVDVERHFGGDVTLLTDGAPPPKGEEAARLRDAKVEVDERPVEGLHDADGLLEVRFKDGTAERFDKAMLHRGWYKVNNELAVMLGARTTGEGYVVTDESSEVVGADGRRIEGLFAVGDLRGGCWKQVVVGWGHAETAVITAYAKRLPDEGEANG